MASYVVYQCSSCVLRFEETSHIVTVLPDGQPGLADWRYCPGCRAIVTIRYADPQHADPALHRAMSGNTGRLLSYLWHHGPLDMVGSQPAKNAYEVLPSPRTLPKVALPIVRLGLVEIAAGQLRLTEDGRRRLQLRYEPRCCPACRAQLSMVHSGSACPTCAGGMLMHIETGRVMVTDAGDTIKTTLAKLIEKARRRPSEPGT